MAGPHVESVGAPPDLVGEAGRGAILPQSAQDRLDHGLKVVKNCSFPSYGGSQVNVETRRAIRGFCALSDPLAAREVFGVLWEEGGSPADVVEARGLRQISDAAELDSVVAQVIADNSAAADKIRSGNQKPIQFLMGQVMKATRGKANPQAVVQLLRRQLGV